MFKTNNEIISIDAKATDPISTGVVFWSHDKGTAKMIFRLRKENVNQTLSEGTIIPILLEFLSATAENGRGRHIYHAVIEDALNGIVSIILEDNILGYQGKVDGSIYIELPDKRSLDTAGRFSFEIKRSPIDEEVPELEDYYWQGFNEIMESYHQTIAGIKSEAKELLDSLKQDVSSTQEKVSQLEQSISTANTNLNARIDEIRKKIDENDVYTKAESSANVIDQIIGKENAKKNITLDYQNKIAGSVVENPHKAAAGFSSVIPTPAQVTGEVSQNAYNALSALDGDVTSPYTATNKDMTYFLVQWNVLEALERELGSKFFTDRGATTTKEKVKIAKEILIGINPVFWGYGKSPSGNKLNFKIWINNSSWAGTRSHNASSVTKMEYNSTGTSTNNYLSDDGYLYASAYAEPSDGAIASTVVGDYAQLNLEIEISANDHIESKIAAYHRENLATQDEAESGESDEKLMTPQTTKQSIEKRSVLLQEDQDIDGIKNYLEMPTFEGKRFLTSDDLPIGSALWTGASFLSASHTIALSKSLNDCLTGIALKFNPYNSSSGSSYTSQTSWWFIPKHHVTTSASGQNTFCPIFKQDGTFVGAKVVTVSPTKLTGADVNALGVLYGYVLTGVYEV